MGLFDWFKKQAKKEDLHIEQKGNETSVFATVTKKEGKSLSPEEANAMREEMMGFLNEGEGDKAINYGSTLLTSGQYEGAIVVYQQIALQQPKEKGVCENQIGAAYFFLGNYKEAIEHYLLAKEAGFEEFMVDDNVWEAAEEHFNNTKDKSLIQVYIEKFPSGENIKKAKKL